LYFEVSRLVFFFFSIVIKCITAVVECLPPAGVLHSQNKVIKCAAYGVAQRRGWRYGFININDMYNNDVGKGGSTGL
jgi:hypothetical protein